MLVGGLGEPSSSCFPGDVFSRRAVCYGHYINEGPAPLGKGFSLCDWRCAMRTGIWRYLRHHHLAFLALFVALGGTSYAAVRIPANSVGTKQIRNNAVTLTKIDIAAQRALRGQHTGLQGPSGLAGLAGAVGKAGPPGTNGANGTNGATKVVVRTGSTSIGVGQLGDAQANCNPGERATGGGEFVSPNSGSPDETIRFSAPSLQSSQFVQPASAGDVPDAWAVEVLNNASASRQLSVYVVCASP
jgi:hypothetical protein